MNKPNARRFFAIHGFLGSPADWDGVAFPGKVARISITDSRFWSSSCSLNQWGERFSAWVRERGDRGDKRLLVGYSLGGRLALHAWRADPLLWSGCILFSTHPGLSDEEEKIARKKADLVWAEKFLKEPWESVLSDWNAQSVFAGHAIMPEEPKEKRFLYHHLTSFSLGRQEDFVPYLVSSPTPFLWIAGGLDRKFATLAKKMERLHSWSQAWILPDVAHRAIQKIDLSSSFSMR